MSKIAIRKLRCMLVGIALLGVVAATPSLDNPQVNWNSGLVPAVGVNWNSDPDAARNVSVNWNSQPEHAQVNWNS